ncbi:MAG: DUF4261 domain-containing protein [Gemmataceae bacterium]
MGKPGADDAVSLAQCRSCREAECGFGFSTLSRHFVDTFSTHAYDPLRLSTELNMGLFDYFRGKKKSSDSKAAVERSKDEPIPPRLCFVLCRRSEQGDLSSASEVVAEVFGPGHSVAATSGSVLTVSRGDNTIGFLAHMPAPIPESEAEENADGNFLWPNGREEAAKHRSHVIVTNVGAGEQTPIQSATTVSRLALVALKLFDGIGVYWGNASVSNSREVFEDFCEDMSEQHVPVPLWLRFQPVRSDDGKLGMYTLGMRQFGLMEIEVDRCDTDGQDLFEFVSNIAHYLIQQGPVIADGNTVGGSEEERIVVRHRPSMIEKKRRVYKIMFPHK